MPFLWKVVNQLQKQFPYPVWFYCVWPAHLIRISSRWEQRVNFISSLPFKYGKGCIRRVVWLNAEFLSRFYLSVALSVCATVCCSTDGAELKRNWKKVIPHPSPATVSPSEGFQVKRIKHDLLWMKAEEINHLKSRKRSSSNPSCQSEGAAPNFNDYFWVKYSIWP